jgi:hypothetical protein
MEYEVKFSEKEDGYLKVKLGDRVIWEYSGRISSSSEVYSCEEYYDPKFYFKFWLYRDNYQKRIKELQQSDDPFKGDKITAINQAILDEKKGKCMEVLFKNYSVKEIVN